MLNAQTFGITKIQTEEIPHTHTQRNGHFERLNASGIMHTVFPLHVPRTLLPPLRPAPPTSLLTPTPQTHMGVHSSLEHSPFKHLVRRCNAWQAVAFCISSFATFLSFLNSFCCYCCFCACLQRCI